ncbi:uncharacterized protein N7483_010125 [Penicillium malachiteum]|uniref:uncharacterized protein n=1 Tax=Penicillium malachiteum TaxID=1324776 RepID=UPI0025492E6B|nr:uncharacterized protein N7483_010125 [Penicillium malachiteum]KAJ5712944.1 hypothetical protein N7483_010125 [Penicillium malachiteum]
MSFLTRLGLAGPLDSPVTNYSPFFLGFQYFYAYGLLSSRTLKQWYGLDHNVSPREDLAKFGEAAIIEGRITRRQLDMLKRNEAAHANSVEGFSLFVAGLGIASVAGVSPRIINAAGISYTVARLAYGAIYILVDHPKWSQLRGLTWWWGNFSCFYLLWEAQKIFRNGA